jgi:hypothetical protein
MEPYLTNPGKKLDWPSKDTLEIEISLLTKSGPQEGIYK